MLKTGKVWSGGIKILSKITDLKKPLNITEQNGSIYTTTI